MCLFVQNNKRKGAVKIEDKKQKVEMLYSKYHGLISYMARMIANDEHIAKDIEQEAILTIIKNIDKIRTEIEGETVQLIKIITRNCGIRILQKMGKEYITSWERERTMADPTDYEDRAANAGIYREVVKIIEEMDEKYRRVLKLWIKGYKAEEIGELLGISKSAAKMRLTRARQQIRERTREKLGDDWWGE